LSTGKPCEAEWRNADQQQSYHGRAELPRESRATTGGVGAATAELHTKYIYNGDICRPGRGKLRSRAVQQQHHLLQQHHHLQQQHRRDGDESYRIFQPENLLFFPPLGNPGISEISSIVEMKFHNEISSLFSAVISIIEVTDLIFG
jgi:hypothetical protein